MKSLVSLLLINILLFSSCSKNEDSGTPPPDSTPPYTPAIGPLDKTNGDLLLKMVRASGINDTQVVKFKWDANNRLINITDSGKINGGRINNKYDITRHPDGKVKKIVSRQGNTPPIVDSIVYDFQYYAVGNQIFHVIGSYYGNIPFNKDSITFSYSSGRIIYKETFNNSSGIMFSNFREYYTYDAQGNIIEGKFFQRNGAGAFYEWNSFVANHNAQKSPVELGDISFIVYGIMVCKNAETGSISTITSGSTISTIETSFSNYLYNTFNRPYEITLTLMPQPPGFTSKLLYFYQ